MEVETTHDAVQTTGDESGYPHAGAGTSTSIYHGGLPRMECCWLAVSGGKEPASAECVGTRTAGDLFSTKPTKVDRLILAD